MFTELGVVKSKIPDEVSKTQFNNPAVRPEIVVQTGVSDLIIHY
jgi:hypothetical protein